jgi:type IV pilus assembly protein PilC
MKGESMLKIDKRIAPVDLARLYQQLADLLLTGISLAECFDILRQDVECAPLANLLDELHRAAQEGQSLPVCFAESSLPEKEMVSRFLMHASTPQEVHAILSLLADEQDQRALIATVKKKLFFWPLTYLLLAVVFLMVLTSFVLPGFRDFYSGFNVELPLLTRMLLLFEPYAIVVAFVLAIVWYSLYKVKVPFVRGVTDRVAVRMPIIGALGKRIAASQYVRTLSLFLLMKIPTHEALEMAARSIENSAIARALERDTTNPNCSLLDNLRASALVPKQYIKAIMIAERTNTWDPVLRYSLETYGMANVDDLVRYQDRIEVFSKIVIGAVFAIIAMAVYMPIFKIGSVS